MKPVCKNKTLRYGALSLALLFVLALFPLQLYAEGSSTPLPETGEAETEAPAEPQGGGVSALASMYAPDFEIAAEAAYVVNAESGVVVYEKNADTPLVAASLVKMMTAILVMEHIEDIDSTHITAESWVYDELYGKNASTADIRRGETLSARELLYAMLLPSANEAALIVAGYISGGYLENFLFLMNQKAQSLGCTGTYFADPNGLSENNLTTARDMYRITEAFMSYPTLVEIASTDSYSIAQHEAHSAAYNIFTTNRLLVPSSPYYTMATAARGAVVAGKTGSLGQWQNFACAAEKEGMTFYSVVLNTPNDADPLGPKLSPVTYRPALYETQLLLDWVYASFSIRSALDTNKAIHQIRVRYSTTDDEVKLLPTNDLKTVLPVDASDADIEHIFTLPESVEAPVKQGDVIGTVTLVLYGEVIGTSELIAAKDVDRNTMLYMVERFKEFFSTWYFKLLVGIVVAGVIVYVALTIYLNNQKRKRAVAARGKAQRPH